ncbi:hypothetical protein HYH03_009480 [Edaphochlamys debaryana]|uniref:Uncharacterized protein n=1 Tax=Edaphochlamys debaryana TaxID=47281 RepID=A0A836BX12_9CHLO|nr:hypothetical protein HYH03_009480 [Edaphochlamys debaryana]|eukprot:KAG2492236.1 hypothetical protein HYH03_009480 [Edaphochlamys debaryana]
MPSRKDRRRAGRRAPAAQHYTAQEVELIATLAEALICGDDAAEGDDMSSMEACLQALLFGKPGHPLRAKAPEAAASSEIPLVAALRQYATLVRTSADAAQAGAGCSRPGLQGPFRRRGSLQTAVLNLIRKTSSSKTPAGTALRLLRFVRGMLAAQPLHALSHQLAAAAAALEPCGDGAGGGPGGADVDAAAVQQGRTALGCFLESALMFYELLLRDSNMYDDLSRTSLAAEVAAERAAGVEELARGLAESGVLEHAARVLLLLQARGPQAVRPREGAEPTLAWEVLELLHWLAGCSSQRREEWWRLAAGALAYGGDFLQDDEYGTDAQAVACELCQLVAEPLHQLWPDGRMDLNALSAEPPAEVAAALAGGLPQALMALVGGAGTGTLSAGSQCVASELLETCDTQFLTPLLAYGDPEWAAAFFAALGSAEGDELEQAQAPPPPSAQAAGGVVGAAAEAPQRCGGVFPTRLGATEPPPLQQLKRVVAQAVELWGLPPAP